MSKRKPSAWNGSTGDENRGVISVASLQDAIFGGQIFVPRQQLLVHHPRDIGEEPGRDLRADARSDARTTDLSGREKRLRPA
jgi:hypothetical protein